MIQIVKREERGSSRLIRHIKGFFRQHECELQHALPRYCRGSKSKRRGLDLFWAFIPNTKVHCSSSKQRLLARLLVYIDELDRFMSSACGLGAGVPVSGRRCRVVS
jgi:hypothetical protein